MNKTISQLLKSCRDEQPSINQDCKNPGFSEIYTNDSLEKLETDMKNFMNSQKVHSSVVGYASINKMLAMCSLLRGNANEATCFLAETHATSLRQSVIVRYIKTKTRTKYQIKPPTYGLSTDHLKYNMGNCLDYKSLQEKLAILPPEWYVLQVTIQHENLDHYKYNENTGNFLYTLRKTHPIHISIFPTGPNAIEPFCLTLPKPSTNDNYDLRSEIESILNKNKSDLSNSYSNRKLYWEMRKRQDTQMKTAVTALEKTWLREWRILFLADPLENSMIVERAHNIIDKLIDDSSNSKEISTSTRWLLKKISTCASYLSKEECARAIKYLLPNQRKLAKHIMLSIQGLSREIESIQLLRRKNLILIIDENLDYIPFEAMEILKNQPVTRFPSIHFTYALFMENRDSIVNGCKVVKISKDIGSFIVNPSCDLLKMETRLKTFIDYWLPNWKGLYGKEPDNKHFEDALVNHDILMYAGHGSGIQYLYVEEIERLRVKAIVLLFGCSSLKLTPVGGRQPPFGVSNQYLAACSPCNLGMLWEVTDGDCDKLTARFMSEWIPSERKEPWSSVDLTKWESGNLVFSTKLKKPEPNEFEMLRAIAKSKNTCLQFMTAAATIVRGLPIILKQV
ncbi:separin [Leptopilina heterotoma]|uniref:separin n=1 Tax=Leptopilina heterotoma TaxID=63436 RepID=UPI001CA907E5|nr:separin [Leptopilina heterotoma]